MHPECRVYPSQGALPCVELGHQLPQDLQDFYRLCSGVELFIGSDYEMKILSPEEVRLANPVLVGERCEEDISASWYLIAKDSDSQHITIDLEQSRLGRCYESFTDSHGLVGDCPVIAFSFADLLTHLLAAQGQFCYWTHASFQSLGDAYDE